jgi:hypothetical protein|tara:strand:+ start:1269 stop:1760 length:492 start_codon:yes stop_codon:yes gene_type:complete
MKVILSPEMVEECRKIGRAREKNLDSTDRWHKDADITGIMGELAFEKLTGLTMDRGTKPDNGWDFEVCGLTIDVKTRLQSNHEIRHLSVKMPPVLRVDVYVLVIVEGNAVDVIGWTPKASMLMWGAPTEFGDKTFWGMPVTMLWDTKQLVDKITKLMVMEGIE